MNIQEEIDKHRKVKIDYSVLEIFLRYFIEYDGVVKGTFDDYGYSESVGYFDKHLRRLAKNILENS